MAEELQQVDPVTLGQASEQVTGETAGWEDAPEAVAEHRSKLVISR